MRDSISRKMERMRFVNARRAARECDILSM